MWFAANLVGFLGGQGIPDPPASASTSSSRPPWPVSRLRSSPAGGLVAAVAGAAIAVGFGVVVGPSAGIVAGGLLAPLVALLVRHGPARSDVEGFEGFVMAPLPHDASETQPDADVTRT
jgi:hypothetical protein